MKNTVVLTSGSGSLLGICLEFEFFRNVIHTIVVDRNCGAENIAKKYGINCICIESDGAHNYSDSLLHYVNTQHIEYIFSYSNLKILKGDILEIYRNRIFNSHFSLLPAFKGFYFNGEAQEGMKATNIFERTLSFGSLVTGNTIHVIEKKIDNGLPILVGVMNIPYDDNRQDIRHKLFILECKTILQFIEWISQDRVIEANNRVYIKDAKFDQLGFSPNLENSEIINLTLKTNYENRN